MKVSLHTARALIRRRQASGSRPVPVIFPVTGYVNKGEIFHAVFSSFGFRNEMMNVPFLFLIKNCLTYRTDAFLTHPQTAHFVFHVPSVRLRLPFPEIFLPFGVIGIRIRSDFHMPSDGNIRHFEQSEFPSFFTEHPFSVSLPLKILGFYPPERFVRVSPFRPSPGLFPYRMVGLAENLTADNMSGRCCIGSDN